MRRLALESGDAEAVAPLLARLSKEAGFSLTLRSLSENLRRFLREVERGYRFSIEEYFNDYSSRDVLREIAEAAPDGPRERIRSWVAEWDAAFDAATRPVGDGSVKLSDDGIGFRAPLRLLPELREGLEEWGHID